MSPIEFATLPVLSTSSSYCSSRPLVCQVDGVQADPVGLLAKALLIDIDPATRWAIPLISGAASDAAPGQPAAPRSTAATDPE
ncbi:conserved protein of unknown function [Modestobacter italicus]|uniref:Uncharacterized protein n=1 Tax=Modestobacter italicus (strain DSM 44449 / CECT 9708 / BC 501) TaxID=2732864 RepID=I4EYM5_MODI5|nr:hypothetical protein [Modestobacter marinus]CCH88488.1 conserved protein of unknown function [Modestobacter marinus]